MNTVQLECFLAVANHLNFAKAAETVCMSQPSVTHQIQKLEAELNTKLFSRSTRSVELTDAGLSFLEDARSILNLSTRAKKRFADPAGTDIVQLKIGCNGLAQMDLFLHILYKLTQKYPNLHPVFSQIPRAQIFTRLDDGDIDIAIAMKDNPAKKSHLIYKELAKTTVCGVCLPEHPLSKLPIIAPEDISPYNLILYNPATADAGTAVIQNLLSADKSPSQIYYCQYPEEAMLMTTAGFGVSILPDVQVPVHYNLAAIPIANSKALSFGLYYKAYQHQEILREFISMAQCIFQKEKADP